MAAHPETVQVWKKTNSKLIIHSIRGYFNDERLKNIEKEEEEEEENAKDKFNSCTNIICIGNIHIAFIAHQIIFHQLS